MLLAAIDMVEQDPDQLKDQILVLSSPLWHSGVIGITASQLVQRYKVPVVLMASDSSIARGSARTVPGVNCYELLHQCQHIFSSFGGHKEAAGFSIEPHQIDTFKSLLRSIARESISSEDCRFTLDIDDIVQTESLNLSFLEQLDQLKPYGQGNPEPLFYSNQLIPLESKPVGNGKHLKATFSDRSGEFVVDAIGFGLVDKIECLYKKNVELIFHLDKNAWMGRETAQLRLIDIR